MKDVREILKKRPLLFDGGMGTYYKAAPGQECEQANLLDPEGIQAVHRAYLAAGADAVKTNTFGLPRMAAAQNPVWEALADEGWKLAVQAAAETGAAAPAVPVKDTVKVADPSGRVLDTPDRGTLYAVQTPQCFRRALYTQALAAVTGEKARLVTDDCSLFELAGLPVRLTEGDYANYKITTKEDLQKEKTMRIGHGYDVHRLVEDRKLIMGGVEIPYEKGLLGHSDADVLLHAVMDAVLGAAALGDIGQHFPDNDPAYKGADSLALTREVARIIAEHGYKVGNIDATILCQRPKLAPHIPAMRRNIADAFGLPVDAVSVKATTEEHLGFTGEGLGIAAHAVALIE